jgi:hypothetical protein
LNGYADRLSSLGDALPGSLPEQSLGSFAQVLTAGLGTAMTGTLTAFGHVSTTMDDVADGMRLTADGYDDTDHDNATTVAAIGGDL